MSFVHHRGVSGEPLGGLGFLGCGLFGRGSPVVQLPSVVPCHPSFVSSSHSTSQLFSHFHQGDSLVSCGSQSPCEGGSRASPLGSWILQSPLCYNPKVTGGWRLVIDLSRLNCSVLVSSFHMETAAFGASVSPSGGLDGVPGSA